MNLFIVYFNMIYLRVVRLPKANSNCGDIFALSIDLHTFEAQKHQPRFLVVPDAKVDPDDLEGALIGLLIT